MKFHPKVAGVALLLTGLITLLLAPGASAKTFKADPAIADTTAASSCTSPCALRQAIAAAEAAEEAAVNGFTSETQTIELPVGTYTLTDGPLRIKHKYSSEPEDLTLTLQGLGARADEVVITAAGKSRVLVDGDFGGTSGGVVLKRLELTGGNGEGGIEPEEPFEPEKGEGGAIAIEQNGTLELDEVLVTENTAASAGGGIEDVGELAVDNSTIAHNTVTGGLGVGGGISSENPNNFSHELVTVVNSTIAENSVSGGSTNEGGAVYNGSVLELTNSTLSGNSAPASGGTLATGSEATSTIANNIIAYDKSRACAGKNPTSLGGNDVADVGCELANQKKTNDISADPGLVKESAEAPKLADNGGPTETIAIADSLSPPVKNGLEQYCPAADQRGASRPAQANCSSGAYQYGTKPAAIISGSVTPTGGGAVTAKSAIAEAECKEATCIVPAEASGKVSFTEAPASGFGFVEWIGCPTITAGSCEVQNDGSNQSVTAKFLPRFTVTAATSTPETAVSAKGSGVGASCAGTGCTVDEGEPVTLTAESKNQGLQFVGWSGGSCHAENPCKLEHVKAAETDTANFELGPPSSPPAGSVRVYLDSGSSSEGNGSSGAPFRSVRAIERLLERREEEIAREHGEVSPLELLFASGEYEGLEFSSAKKISVYGDLNPSTWKAEREPVNPTSFTGRPQGLLLNRSTEISFQQVAFKGLAGNGSISAYGVRMINGSHATFAEVHVEGGLGANGASGANGAQGAVGTNGEHGNPGDTPGDVLGKIAEHSFLGGEFYGELTCPQAAANGIWSMSFEELKELYYEGHPLCPNIPLGIAEGQKPERSPNPGNGGFGGRGGFPNGDTGEGWNGQKGNSTANAEGGVGGHGGVSESTWCCQNGKSATSPGGEGGAGGAGSSGVNAQGVASSYSNVYSPGHGGAGGEGEGGAGGGGGGGGSGDFDDLNNGGGDSGGSGGSGGYGGGGGRGGEAGGGSFALYVASGSTAVVDYASDLVADGGGSGGNGGSGGAGGAGGAGGQGSAYAATTIGAGSNGGAGGGGGPGGPGAGGEGGPSFAVAGGGAVELGTGVLENVTRPGEGGEPGGEGGRPAHSGGGGPNEPCSSDCKVNPQLPVQLPPTATVSGGTVIIAFGCAEACTGKLALTGIATSRRHIKALAFTDKHNSHSGGASVLGKLSFSLPAKKITKLRIHLSKAARKQLKNVASMKATLTVELKLGKAKKQTKYNQSLVLYGPKAKTLAPAKK